MVCLSADAFGVTPMTMLALALIAKAETVQVTVWLPADTAAQVAEVGVTESMLKPAGTTSVIVITPVVAAVPLLVTVSV